ncbi:MAG: hypothetical protein ACYCZI_10120 [Metallibacterium scheffleri]
MKMCETQIDRLDVFGKEDGRKIAYAIASVLNLQAELAELVATANAVPRASISDKGRENLGFLATELFNATQQIQSCRAVLEPFGGATLPWNV